MRRSSPVWLLAALLPALAAAQVPIPAGPTTTRGSTTVQAPPQPPAPSRSASLPAPPVPVKAPPPLVPRPVPAPPSRATPSPLQDPATRTRLPGSSAPAKVYDREGRIVPGLRPAGANRVFDTRTGRYYDAVPVQGGAQVKP